MRGDRDKKIDILCDTDSSGQNEYGEPDPACATPKFKGLWASVTPLSGKDYWQAEQAQSKISTRIELDYIPGIDRSMRVVYGSRIFRIIAVINIKEMNRTLQLLCEEMQP